MRGVRHRAQVQWRVRVSRSRVLFGHENKVAKCGTKWRHKRRFLRLALSRFSTWAKVGRHPLEAIEGHSDDMFEDDMFDVKRAIGPFMQSAAKSETFVPHFSPLVVTDFVLYI